MTARRWTLVIAGMVLALAGPVLARRAQDRFDHWQHRALFPSCTSCHLGAQDTTAPMWPATASCATCHDGTIEKQVQWTPPAAPPTNLKFTHAGHAAASAAAHRDSAPSCRACHNEPGGERMRVHLAVARNCLDCHGVRASHFDAPDPACATCHLPLARASRLTAADIAKFPRPASHDAPDFLLRRHGELAQRGPKTGVAASCAVCHARNFCADCHVDAPELAAIQALAPDPRVSKPSQPLRAPPSHGKPDFIRRHGGGARAARAGARTCATCHTQESCLACHVGTPRVARALPVASPARGRGAVIIRRRPASHGEDFSETHAASASARPTSCAGCHARTECLECHQPNPASASPGYHPAGFLSTHPVAAYQRRTDCANCHNVAQFCTSCHASAGLVSDGRLNAGYHDAKRFFLAGHGQAARQSLESCTACHTERDCMTCHAASATGGRGVDPHGPGFDADRLRKRNPQMCTACHGAAIPGGD